MSDATERSASQAHRTFAIMLAGFCAFLDLYATQPLLPLLARIFDASEVRVSLTVTLATAAVALAAPFAGSISDRIGRKRTIVWSSVALGVFTALAALSPDLNALLFWRFLQGVFTPGIFAVTIAYIHDEWRGAESGRATAAYVGGTVVGGFSGRFISGFVATHMSWQWVFVVLGVLNLCGAAAMWKWLPRERRQSVRAPVAGWAAVADHLRNGRLLATYAVGFCVLFAMTAAFTYVTFYLAAPPFRLSPSSLGSLFFVYLIGAIITPASGRWIDRYGQRVALAAAIGGGVFGILLTLIGDVRAVIAGLAICCTGVFIAQASASSYIGVAARHNRALAVGLYATCYYAGGSAGAALPGLFWQRGGWPGCVALIAGVQILTVALALSLWSRKEHAPLPERQPAAPPSGIRPPLT